MKQSFLSAGLVLAAAAVTIAAVSKPAKHLTPQRVAEVNALSDSNPDLARVSVAISGVSKVRTVSDGRKAVLEMIREFRFPTAFNPPAAPKEALAGKTNQDGVYPITPTTPTEFETLNTGWTITLTTKARGGLVEVYGVADFVEVDLIAGGYGALSGPIITDQGVLITPNRLDLPKSKTTTTRFHVFALPGESYDVTLYRGTKAEKHTVTVAAE
ncbi:MAG: hypothetical protein ACAI37_05430 [Chthoniobacter sp.]